MELNICLPLCWALEKVEEQMEWYPPISKVGEMSTLFPTFWCPMLLVFCYDSKSLHWLGRLSAHTVSLFQYRIALYTCSSLELSNFLFEKTSYYTLNSSILACLKKGVDSSIWPIQRGMGALSLPWMTTSYAHKTKQGEKVKLQLKLKKKLILS